jgi:hypothetical protein
MYLYLMKRSRLALLLPILSTILLGSRCKPESPEITPCFTVVEDTFRDPREPVVFVNCSAGADSYFWQFGDGTTSTEVSPAHTFTQVGTFDVRLTASLGDAQEIFIRRIRVDYPRFRKVRVLEMPVLNPANGLPWDSDGSGLDLRVLLTKSGDNGVTFAFPFATDITLPYEFVTNEDVSIDAYWWQFELDRWDTGSVDTVGLGTLNYADLIDAPIETVAWDSTVIEFVLEGIQ